MLKPAATATVAPGGDAGASPKPAKAPGNGLHVKVKNAVYEVPFKGARLTILKGISIECKPGRLLAIMGPSGSGKTSLLNLIGGKMDLSSGELLLNGNTVKRSDILKLSSYVEQDDSLMSVLTVRETLHLAAKLQLPSSKYTEAQKIAVAEKVMNSLHIQRAADTRVGDPKEGIVGVSGGERKRVSTGVALVKNPHLLLCDEPTSGLDSATAMIIIRTLRDLARAENRTIVVTIHQPSSDCFALFDDLLIVQHGQVVYNGTADMSMDYFESIGYKCPAFSNPADFYFMHVLSVPGDVEQVMSASGAPAKTQRRGSAAQNEREDTLAKAWKASTEYRELLSSLDNTTVTPLQLGNSEGNNVPFSMQLRLLVGRAFKQVVRNKMRGRARLMQAIVVGLIIGLVYLGMGNSQSSLADRSGVLFLMVTNTLMSGTSSVITTFANERSTFLREHQGGLYGVGPYFISKLAVETPIYMLASMIYYNIVYWMVGLQPVFEKWGTGALVILSVQLTSNSLGILLASMFARIEVAMALMPLVVLPMLLFSGFVLNSENVPIYFRWLEAISPIRYGFVGLSLTEFSGLEVSCTPEERIQITVPSCDAASGNESTRVFDGGCRFKAGDDFLRVFLKLEEGGLSVEECIIFNLAVAFLITWIAYFGLRRLGKAKGTAG